MKPLSLSEGCMNIRDPQVIDVDFSLLSINGELSEKTSDPSTRVKRKQEATQALFNWFQPDQSAIGLIG